MLSALTALLGTSRSVSWEVGQLPWVRWDGALEDDRFIWLVCVCMGENPGRLPKWELALVFGIDRNVGF